MTIGTITVRAREILDDTNEGGYRWSDAVICRYVLDAIDRLRSLRPDTKYNGLDLYTYSRPDVPTTPTAEELQALQDTEVLIECRFEEALAEYAVYKCFLIDGADVENLQLANTHLTVFNNLAQT